MPAMGTDARSFDIGDRRGIDDGRMLEKLQAFERRMRHTAGEQGDGADRGAPIYPFLRSVGSEWGGGLR